MIILPLLFSVAMFFVMYLVLVAVTGIDMMILREYSARLDPTYSYALELESFYAILQQEFLVQRINQGHYVVIDPNFTGDTRGPHQLTSVLAFPMVIPIGFILITSLFLTRFVFRPILTSISTLSRGVEELSSGNLTYRITHQTGNEFDEVCANFNGMAERLLEMVKKTGADEQSRRELIAGISHDLRTPLTSIKAYIEGLKKGVATTPKMQEKYLTILENKTNDIDYIINQLFMFAQMDVGEFPFNLQRVDLNQILIQLFPQLDEEYKQQGLTIQLDLSTDPASLPVTLDVVQFQNVVQNILNNAVKYGHQAQNTLTIRTSHTEGQVVISLQDNGPGVPPEILDQIFTLFYRSDVARENPSTGSGLGLAICAKIIHRLGGTIHAENNSGLNILISLPKNTTKE